MDKNKLQEFTFRVAQASRSELIVIMYDIILADTEDARAALEVQDIESFQRELKHAGRFMNELMGALDYQYAISHELISLYSYVNKMLIQAGMQKNVELLDIADSIMKKLKVAFEGVSAQDTSGPVMQNAEQVYAGLTYGRGTLNESLVDLNGAKRGFMA